MADSNKGIYIGSKKVCDLTDNLITTKTINDEVLIETFCGCPFAMSDDVGGIGEVPKAVKSDYTSVVANFVSIDTWFYFLWSAL